MADLEQPKWYILHTYSGYEAMVKDSLEKLIENNNLGDYIVDLKIPMEQVIEEKNGKRKVVERSCAVLCLYQDDLYQSDLVLCDEYARSDGILRPAGAADTHEGRGNPKDASRRVRHGHRFQAGRYGLYRRRAVEGLLRHGKRAERRRAESEDFDDDVRPQYRCGSRIYSDQEGRRASARTERGFRGINAPHRAPAAENVPFAENLRKTAVRKIFRRRRKLQIKQRDGMAPAE